MKNKKRASLKYLLTFILIFMWTQIVFAGTYYVANNGVSSWNQATNIQTPCSVYSGMANAQAGDTVYFRGGTYNFTYSYQSTWVGLIHPSNSGTSGNPIVFMAYPDETPIWNVTGEAESEYTTLFSTSGKEYIVLDGFTVTAGSGTRMTSIALHGDVGLGGTYKKGCVVQNMIIDGGDVYTGNNNREGLRIEDVDGAIIRNNTIYDYSGSNDNYAGIKLYHVENCIVENNYIYNCVRGVYSKSVMNGTHIRYNYIKDVNIGIYDNSYTNQTISSNDNIVHNNLIVNGAYMGIRWKTEDGVTDSYNVFYNNTLYECDVGIRVQNGTGWEIYNNVIRREAGSSRYHIALGETYELDKCDHNLFDNSLSFNITDRFDFGSQTTYTSLASWQSSGELTDSSNPGEGSFYADPDYEDYSGNMENIADFKLKISSDGYQSGVGGIDMGANMDSVGVKNSSQTGQAPSRPKNLRISSD